MLNNTVCLAALAYGIATCVWLQRRRRFRDGIVMLLLCGVIALYCAPVIGKALPTAASVYTYIYHPVSSYMLKVMGIKQEG
ncbi:hypothetical protein [Paenibacillus sp. R14(2021)]|uniref:hypothetical protein n=1 Tax=Paenibacillus sp. R14(2021) TaxID=2859228 RepID=UPI001C61142A|nr:hypothetical protein [Paenibacillus sp. R14(2021)]